MHTASAPDFTPYTKMLNHFGIQAASLENNLNLEQKQKLIQTFKELDAVFEVKNKDTQRLQAFEKKFTQLKLLKKEIDNNEYEEYKLLKKQLKQLSDYAIINWSEVLLELETSQDDINKIASLSNALSWNNYVNKADTASAWIYYGLNLFGLILTLLATQHHPLSGIDDNKPASAISASWSYFDALNGALVGIRHIKQGEIGLGIAAFMGSMQLIATTIIFNVAKFGNLVLPVGVAFGLMGFSFAMGMGIGFSIEMIHAKNCRERINYFENKLAETRNQVDNKQQSETFQKLILLEKAKEQNHLRAAKSLAGTAMIMITIALIAFIGLSGVTFGALPAATVIMTGASFLINVVRRNWANYVDHAANIKSAMKADLLSDLHKIIHRNVHEINFEFQVPDHKSMIFKNKPQPLKIYLEEMAIYNPKKLKEIIEIFKKSEDIKPIVKILHDECHYIHKADETIQPNLTKKH